MSAVAGPIESAAGTLQLVAAAISEAAGRERNEDVALARPLLAAGGRDGYLLAIADGMGGHPAGEVASRIAVETLVESLNAVTDVDLGLALKQAYRKANDAIYEAGRADASRAGMGTTLTAALLRGQYATVANVGDSRAYLLRGSGLTQVTRDHTVAEDEVAAGRITSDAVRRDPRRNILTQVVGTSPRLDGQLPNVFELTLLPGDRLLLCSDGLYDVLDDGDLRHALLNQDPDEAARDLVALARQRGTRDNASAVVAAAIPTRVPAVTVPQPAPRTGGFPGTAIAAVVAVLLVALLLLALFLLGAV